MTQELAIETHGLCHPFGSGDAIDRVLHSVDLEICRGKGVILMGPSGKPTAALDKERGQRVFGLLRRLAVERGTTVFMVTHDHRVLDFADRIVKMEDGRVLDDTTAAGAIAKLATYFHNSIPSNRSYVSRTYNTWLDTPSKTTTAL